MYATIFKDLKPVAVAHIEERKEAKQNLINLAMLLADFYSNFLDA